MHFNCGRHRFPRWFLVLRPIQATCTRYSPRHSGSSQTLTSAISNSPGVSTAPTRATCALLASPVICILHVDSLDITTHGPVHVRTSLSILLSFRTIAASTTNRKQWQLSTTTYQAQEYARVVHGYAQPHYNTWPCVQSPIQPPVPVCFPPKTTGVLKSTPHQRGLPVRALPSPEDGLS